jgi:hypothetical protein
MNDSEFILGSFLPSLANPKSVSLSIASFALVVKSKFSGFRSPIIETTQYSMTVENYSR